MGFRARVSHHRPPCRAVERTCNAAMKLTYKAIRQPGIPHSVVIGAPGFLVGSGMNSGLPSCRTSGRRRALGFEPTNCTQRHAVLRMPAAERACVELGRLATHPRQTRGSLVSPLLARAGSRSDVGVFGSAIAYTWFRTNQHQTTSACCTQRHAETRMPVAGRACAELGRLASRSRQARAGLSLPSSPVLARVLT